METTQRGSGIWSYTLRRAGAILLVNVPATIMTSDWRGEARKTIPNRSMSYREAAACIISTAQQASPNVMGQSEPLRAQLTRSSTREIAYSTLSAVGTFPPPCIICSTFSRRLSAEVWDCAVPAMLRTAKPENDGEVVETRGPTNKAAPRAPVRIHDADLDAIMAT
mmetsp:Transcript_97003/g.259138  ORF Transcript_97003/g.259138 Transcript_97003/m.259138 type:complete len:166 (+) Transcript_97003:232-729(+)